MLASSLKSVIKRLFSKATIDRTRLWLDRFVGYREITYSQFGEDLFLREYFKDKANGFYVDIGAYHPCQFSNTFFLYQNRGWHGINVEANPACIRLFNQIRKRDINLNVVVSDRNETVQYHSWGISSENSMDPAQVNALTQRLGAAPKVIELAAQPLSQLLDRHCSGGQAIDLLNVDVEGSDLAVLKSNDWSRYRPQIVAVEQFGSSLEALGKTDLYQYLLAQGYGLIAWYRPTLIFERQQTPRRG